jgi:hypothetical protein
MGFFSSFSSGTTDGPAGSFATDGGGIISVDEAGNVTQDGVSAGYDVGPSLAEKAGAAAGRMLTVRGKDGKINVPLTLLDTAAKVAFPGYGIVRGGMGAIDAIFGPTTMTAEEAAAEQASYTALAEANVSPSIPPDLLSQGQQDPAAQQALFGPTHIYGALPGQARRRGAYQYIPPTFGPRS